MSGAPGPSGPALAEDPQRRRRAGRRPHATCSGTRSSPAGRQNADGAAGWCAGTRASSPALFADGAGYRLARRPQRRPALQGRTRPRRRPAAATPVRGRPSPRAPTRCSCSSVAALTRLTHPAARRRARRRGALRRGRRRGRRRPRRHRRPARAACRTPRPRRPRRPQRARRRPRALGRQAHPVPARRAARPARAARRGTARLGPTRADELLDVATAAVGRRREPGSRCAGGSLESPVLTVADLPEEHAEWWRRNRHREREWFHDRLRPRRRAARRGGASPSTPTTS